MTDKSEKKAVDLSGLSKHVEKQEAGIDVVLKGMDGETPLGVTIRVAGPDSKRAQQANEEITDEMIDEGEGNTRLKARERTRRAIQFLAKLTIGWEPAIVIDGEELKYSEENAIKLYTRFKFIRDQVDVAAGNRKRFMQG